MAKDKKPIKVKADKKYTRAQAEKAISAGVDPALFVGHGNYHVRVKAWCRMGKPTPENQDQLNRLLVTFQGRPFPKDAEGQATMIANLRAKFLGEANLPELQE